MQRGRTVTCQEIVIHFLTHLLVNSFIGPGFATSVQYILSFRFIFFISIFVPLFIAAVLIYAHYVPTRPIPFKIL